MNTIMIKTKKYHTYIIATKLKNKNWKIKIINSMSQKKIEIEEELTSKQLANIGWQAMTKGIVL